MSAIVYAFFMLKQTIMATATSSKKRKSSVVDYPMVEQGIWRSWMSLEASYSDQKQWRDDIDLWPSIWDVSSHHSQLLSYKALDSYQLSL